VKIGEQFFKSAFPSPRTFSGSIQVSNKDFQDLSLFRQIQLAAQDSSEQPKQQNSLKTAVTSVTSDATWRVFTQVACRE